jgi:hypothetical protein
MYFCHRNNIRNSIMINWFDFTYYFFFYFYFSSKVEREFVCIK